MSVRCWNIDGIVLSEFKTKYLGLKLPIKISYVSRLKQEGIALSDFWEANNNFNSLIPRLQ